MIQPLADRLLVELEPESTDHKAIVEVLPDLPQARVGTVVRTGRDARTKTGERIVVHGMRGVEVVTDEGEYLMVRDNPDEVLARYR